MLQNEHKYAIYRIEAKWDEHGYNGNRTGLSVMYKEDIGIEAFKKYALEWWEEYIRLPAKAILHEHPLITRHPHNLKLEAKFIEHETWCQGWFSHYTYNTHLSDEELRKSFDDFVCRKERLVQQKEYCLMGAEDYWRWKGPCRCEHCVKLGIVRIDH